MATLNIERRAKQLVNTDPQRRCYNGCHYSTALVDTPWQVLQLEVPAERVEERLTFWRELNDYAVSQRGEESRAEFRATPTQQNNGR